MQRHFLFILLVIACKTAYNQTDTLRYGKVGYFLKRAVDFESKKEYDQAIAFTDTALKIAPTSESVFAVKAEILWMMKRFSEAAENYQKALLLDTDGSYLFGAYLFLGVLYEKANKPIQAQAQYLKAVYFFENKKEKNDKFFADVNRLDYALALKLSGNNDAWDKLLNEPFYKNSLAAYVGKTREQILEIYFQPFSGG